MATIRSHAERLLAAQDSEWLREAAADIATAMRARWNVRVEERESFPTRGYGGWCDGMSIAESGIVLYRPTGGRRSRFTLAHELAHIIVESDDEALTWLGDREQVDRDLEQICDVIAAQILIPEWSIERALDGRPPTAAALTRLHNATTASWSACAIAVANRLPCDGFVAIVNRETSTVMFAARSRDTHPYAWTGDNIPKAHVLRGTDPPTTSRSFWPRFNVNEPRPYYVSVECNASFAHAVFAENDLWSVDKLHLPGDDQEDRRYDGTIDCPSCGYKGRTAMYPCTRCHSSTCQRCGKCDCDRANERPRVMCAECTAFVLPHLVEGGYCLDCRRQFGWPDPKNQL